MEVLAIIPARGGSKSIPRKNIIPFLGRPLISWSIAAAHSAKSITRTIVSTDDEEIAAVAHDAGAEIPFLRPAKLASDDVVDYPVIRHVIDTLEDTESYCPDVVVQLRPTSPLRPEGLIDDGVGRILDNPGADSLRVVCEPVNNPYKMWRLDGDLMLPLFDAGIPEQYNMPRQKLPTAYWQIGILDVIRTRTIIEQESLTGERVMPLIVDPALAVDIDDDASLRRAEEACRAFSMDKVFCA
ncbi:MAG: acylneuraminate cytidylyltransferase family protein [Alphaproteobacteria bacterium]|nr:acylneuraminate cytidylyltransferase family protein [Alphaproteobacteria bacterium]